jgi:hypothetical protein
VSESFDIAVIGSGAAGIAAAVTAARAGAKTLLLDKNPVPGGTGGLSGLTTLCGLFDDSGNYLNEGFAQEFAGAVSAAPPLKMGRVWVLPYRPGQFCAVAGKMFNALPNLETRWNSPLENVRQESERKSGRIVAVNGFPVGAVIDASGDAVVAEAAGAECQETTEATQASAVIFELRNVTRDLQSLAEAAQILLPIARAGFPPVNFQPGPEPHSVTAKFTGRPEQVAALIEFLRAQVRGFENCSTPVEHFSSTCRAGRMIVGEYVLTGADVLAGARFADAAARCAWPIEQWNAEGVVKYQYLPPDAHYEIPARSLRAAKIRNLFMAGKTISADVDAIASARVMGCCLATGAAAGKLAVDYLNSTHQK